MTTVLNKKLCSIKLESIPKVSNKEISYVNEPDALTVEENGGDSYNVSDTTDSVRIFVVGPATSSRVFPPNFDQTNYAPTTNNKLYGTVSGSVVGYLNDGSTVVKVIL